MKQAVLKGANRISGAMEAPRKGIKRILIAGVVAVSPLNTYADISSSMFADAASRYELDPVLLYSIALAESAKGSGDGNVAPWPWTLRVISEPGIYAKNSLEAKQQLSRLLSTHTSIDIGMMQINLKYHGHRVSSPEDLLDPETSINVGAQILRETLDSAGDDLELGIGRYHNWTEERARNYGARILAFYRNIKSQQ